LWHHYGTFFPHIVREMQNIQILDTISLTLHYTYYFYCVTNTKTYITFLSLFIIQIIYSIVWQIQNIQTISPTFHYTNYLFYCERKTKTYKNCISWQMPHNGATIVINVKPFGYSSRILRRRICLSSLNYFQFITIYGKLVGRFSHILWEKYKTTKMVYHFSHSSLYKLFILLCDKIQNNKNGISFLSLFIIQIIYSIVWQNIKHT
jgi:hypothetical protein